MSPTTMSATAAQRAVAVGSPRRTALDHSLRPCVRQVVGDDFATDGAPLAPLLPRSTPRNGFNAAVGTGAPPPAYRVEQMKHALIRLLVATVVLCGVANQARAQAAAAALSAIPDLAPLYNPVPIDSVATHRSWAGGRGIYAFFASDTARAFLRRAGLSVGDDGLVYIGQTKNSFRQRLTNHLTGTSNLCNSLKSILSHMGSRAARADVSRFMRSHLRVGMLSLDDAAVIDAVEARLIRAKSPPLNTAGVSNGNTKRLKQLRRVLATTSTTPTGAAVSTLAKGTGLAPWLSFQSPQPSSTCMCGTAERR